MVGPFELTGLPRLKIRCIINQLIIKARVHYLKISSTKDYNEFEVSYLCIIQSIYYIFLRGKVHRLVAQ